MTRVSVSTVQRAYILTVSLAIAEGAAAAQVPQAEARRAVPAAKIQQILAVQIALDRAGFSPGEIDGQEGAKTRLALEEFQRSSNLPGSGTVDENTLAALRVPAEPLISYTIARQDVAGPFIDTMPGDVMESAKLTAFGYTTPLEALAEKFHSSPALLTKLNPGTAWAAGDTILVPAVEPFEVPSKADPSAPPAAQVEIVVTGDTKSLTVRDAAGKTLMHAPVTIGSEKDPLPVGDWEVVGVFWNPVFHYNPELFWDANPAHSKAKIPAGPNNPVGVVWVDINKEHFGLHGTPEPSAIGRTESHGCIRLTNWDAAKLGRFASPGFRVTIR